MSETARDPLIEQIAAELKRPVRVDARFDERVMAAITAPDVIPLRPIERRPWILRPWTLSVSPLGAFAAAAAIAGFVIIGVWNSRPEVSQLASDAAVESPLIDVANAPGGFVKQHQFYLVDRTAKSVTVVGDFNNWDATVTPMTRVSEDGVWTVTVPLAAGSYQYQFIVNDSQRVIDPKAPVLSNEFGSPNSVITVGPPGIR